MKAIKLLRENRVALICMLLFVGILGILHQFVILYGDDYQYSTAIKGSLHDFLNFHVNHYLRGNGRALIHVAITLCLGDCGVAFWKILNPIILGLTVLFAAKTFSDNENFGTVLITMCIVLLGLGRKYTAHSIYTLTPVFNYVYPFIFMFPLVFYSKQTYLSEDKQAERKTFLPLLGFFAGASMEQTGIMAIGYIVMLVFEKLVMERKLPKRNLWITLFATLIGYLTVMLAPGNFVRMETSTRPFTENFIAAFTMLINQKSFLLFNAFLICSFGYWLIHTQEKNIYVKWFNRLLTAGLFAGYAVNTFIIFGVGDLSFDTPGIIDIAWKLFDLGYIFAMFYVPVYVFMKEARWDILTHMIMALGSIVILFFASISEWRPLTPAILVFAVFISLTVADAKKHSVFGYKAIASVAIILSLIAVSVNLAGVAGNHKVSKTNEARIEAYLQNKNYTIPLVLLPVEDEEARGYGINISGYTYTYPLSNPALLNEAYSLSYKKFYGIPIDTTIIIE